MGGQSKTQLPERRRSGSVRTLLKVNMSCLVMYGSETEVWKTKVLL